MSKLKYFKKNLAGHQGWEESFMGKLVEEHFWDKNEFWHLHAELTHYAIEHKHDFMLSRRLSAEVARMIYLVMITFAEHESSSDFHIVGLEHDEIYPFIERVELLSSAFFSGDILGEDSFELQNPLLLE